VIVDQGLLGVGDRIFDRLHLLGEIKAWVPLLDHRDDGPKVPFGTPEPFDDLGVIMMVHRMNPYSWRTIVSSP
jgi:hypothetical protein